MGTGFMQRYGYYLKSAIISCIFLYKISFASAISSKLDCVRLALSLHKISFASAISSKLDCVRLALSLQHIHN